MTQRPVLARLASLIALATLASACGGDPAPANPDPNTTTPDSSAGHSSCGLDALNDDAPVTCQAGTYCADRVLNRCVEGCLDAMNCATGETCVKAPDRAAGECLDPNADPCEDVSCREDQVCMDGGCVDVPPIDPCDGVMCGANQTCMSGTCVNNPPGDPCQGVMCGANQTCMAGTCMDNPPVDPCQGVVCMVEGEVCEEGECVNPNPPLPCTVTLTGPDGCPADQLCRAEGAETVCVSLPACDGDDLCDPGGSGAVCTSAFLPDKSPQCFPSRCLDASHCPQTQLYCVKTTSQTLGGCADGAEGSPCTDDTQCADARVCMGGDPDTLGQCTTP